MAKETAITQFIGVDHTYRFPVLDEAEAAAVDCASWSMSWMLKKSKGHVDADAKVTKTTAGTVTVAGVYSSDPAVNTQRVVVPIEDTDTDPLPSGAYYHELKRTGAGVEAILSYGTFTLEKAVHKA